MRLSDENLRGRTVIAADGQAIGEIAALFLDSDAWRVESLQVKLRDEVADQLGARAVCFTLGYLRCQRAWFSQSAMPSFSPWLHMSCNRFCRVGAMLRRHISDGYRRIALALA
jgi:hypothetical protein